MPLYHWIATYGFLDCHARRTDSWRYTLVFKHLPEMMHTTFAYGLLAEINNLTLPTLIHGHAHWKFNVHKVLILAQWSLVWPSTYLHPICDMHICLFIAHVFQLDFKLFRLQLFIHFLFLWCLPWCLVSGRDSINTWWINGDSRHRWNCWCILWTFIVCQCVL